MRDRITLNFCPRKHNQPLILNTTIQQSAGLYSLVIIQNPQNGQKQCLGSGFNKMTFLYNKTATSFDVALILYQYYCIQFCPNKLYLSNLNKIRTICPSLTFDRIDMSDLSIKSKSKQGKVQIRNQRHT